MKKAFHQTTGIDPGKTVTHALGLCVFDYGKISVSPSNALTHPVARITSRFFVTWETRPSKTALHHTTEIDNERKDSRPTIFSHGDFVFLTTKKSQCHPVKSSTSPVAWIAIWLLMSWETHQERHFIRLLKLTISKMVNHGPRFSFMGTLCFWPCKNPSVTQWSH